MLTLENVQTSRYNAFHFLWAMEQGRRKRRQKLTRSHSVRTHFLSQRTSGQVPPFSARPSSPIFCFQSIKLSEESQKWPIRHLLCCEPDLVRKSHAFHIFLTWKNRRSPCLMNTTAGARVNCFPVLGMLFKELKWKFIQICKNHKETSFQAKQ